MKSKKVCGVYRLTFSGGDFYIGSSRDIRRRVSGHLSAMRGGKHENRVVQAAFEKHGEPVASVVLVCREEDRLFYEQLLLDGMRPRYNMADRAGAPSPECMEAARRALTGRGVDEETRARISAALTGRSLPEGHPMRQRGVRRHSEETLEKMRGRVPWNKGKACRPETREKLRQANLGKTLPKEVKEKLRGRPSPKRGTTLSEEQKEKIRQALIGRSLPDEVKAKLKGRPAWNKGRTHTEEQKAKLRAAWERRKAKADAA